MATKNILAMVLEGGKGSRVNRGKSAALFGGRYRPVDFVLSNLVNSGIDTIYLLAQYQPETMIEHVQENWDLASAGRNGFISVVQPRYAQGEFYRGTADAVYKNLVLIEKHAPSMVAVCSADHIYRMDVRQMVEFHCECNADATVAATRVPLDCAPSFCIISAGDRGEIRDFQEKPEWPDAIPSHPGYAYASMGSYLFNTDVLVESLEQALRDGETDFGGYVMPRLIRSHHVHAYDFAENLIPGMHAFEEPFYWRDVGALMDYAAAHLDMAGAMPRFSLSNPHWPVLPARFSPHFGPDESYQQSEIMDVLLAKRDAAQIESILHMRAGTA